MTPGSHTSVAVILPLCMTSVVLWGILPFYRKVPPLTILANKNVTTALLCQSRGPSHQHPLSPNCQTNAPRKSHKQGLTAATSGSQEPSEAQNPRGLKSCFLLRVSLPSGETIQGVKEASWLLWEAVLQINGTIWWSVGSCRVQLWNQKKKKRPR